MTLFWQWALLVSAIWVGVLLALGTVWACQWGADAWARRRQGR